MCSTHPSPLELAASLGAQPATATGTPAARFGTFPAFRPSPDPADIAMAAEVLMRARKPIILAGGGVLISGAEAELTQCAELLSAAIATSLSGKGSVSEEHPLAMGVIGSMGNPAATAAMDEADVVLLVGTKAGSGPTFNWTRPRPDQIVVQLDIDPAELGRVFPLAAAILADARGRPAGIDRRARGADAASTRARRVANSAERARGRVASRPRGRATQRGAADVAAASRRGAPTRAEPG